MSSTVDRVLRDARTRLAVISDSPELDARRLLEHVLGVDHAWLIVHAADRLAEAVQTRFAALLARRVAGEPLAYITGRAGFWTLELDVTPDVLIPRPDTETLVEAILDRYDARPLQVLDLGTGSGAIALALAAERPRWQITATDASAPALACAAANAKRLGLAHIAFGHGHWYAPVAGQVFDLIVSNPPYIAAGDRHLDAPALRHEPQTALVAAENGLADLEQITMGAASRLNANGALFVEHGADQADAVRARLRAAGFAAVATLKDLGGNARVSHGRRGP